MLDPDHVAAQVAARLPEEWHRAAAVPGLRYRIVEVLRDPAHGDLATQLNTLVALLKQGPRLTEQEWIAWATYAFGRPVAHRTSTPPGL